MYEERFYRKSSLSKFSLEVAFKESDLFISTDTQIDKEKVQSILQKYYNQIEGYTKKNSLFLSSLSPIEEDESSPPIVLDMIQTSYLTGIGPFSSVAGAIAQYVGLEILKEAAEVIIENGGDIFLKINEDKRLGVYLGERTEPKNLTLKISKREDTFGIASSSAYFGHSLNLGRADLVTIIAKDAIIADGFATSLSNRIQKETDADQVIAIAKDSPYIEGILISFEGKLYLWGDIEIIS